MPYKPTEREYRQGESFSLIQPEHNDELIISGTPIVFDTPTVLCVIDGVEYKEIIASGALDRCDMSDFILNRNHGTNDSTVYARTKNGSLRYEITAGRMNIQARLDSADERHKNFHRDIEKGLIDKMSFSMVVEEDSYDRETRTRTILRIKKLYDVSAVDFPAYNDTSITTARDFFAAEHELESVAMDKRRRLLIIKALT